MPISNKYSEIEITNSNITKLFDTSSFYIVIAVITLKTEKTIQEIIEKVKYKIHTPCVSKWNKEKYEIWHMRNKSIFEYEELYGKEKALEEQEKELKEADKREETLKEVKKKDNECLKTFDLAICKLVQQYRLSEKINNEGIIIEENEYQKYEHVLKEKIEKLIKEKEESYKLIVDDLTQLKEFEYVKQEDLNVEELIEELKSTLEVVKKLQIYI